MWIPCAAMANTKKLTQANRKKTKRAKRLENKEKWASLTKTVRREFRKAHKSDKAHFLPWYRQRKAEKDKAAETPPA